MFLQPGGGGKGTRPQSTHQQNISHSHQQLHQTPHHHHQQTQQNRNSHIPQDQQQQQVQVQQQGQQLSVFVPQQNVASAHSNHHPLSHAQQQQQKQQQQQQQQHQQVQQQQTQLHHSRDQQHHQLQQQQSHHQPVIFVSQPPPSAHYGGQGQHASGGGGGINSNASGIQFTGSGAGGLQQVNSSTALGHGNANTGLVRALNNTGLQHFTPSAGLIATAGSNAGGAGPTAAFMTTTYIPFSHHGSLLGAPTVGFSPSGNGAAAASAGFFATSPQQKQIAVAQQHAVNMQAAASSGAATSGAPAQAIAYYHSAPPPATSTNNPSNMSHRASMRAPRAATPQQTNYFAYAVPTVPTPRATLMNPAATATVTPIMNPRSAALNGTAAFHMPPTFCPSIPLGASTGLAATPMMAPAGMTPQQAGAPAGALHTYATHLQAAGASAVGGAFSATSLQPLTAPGQSISGKAKERKHAIPIIHPDTMEVLDTKSSVFLKKDLSTATLTAGVPGGDQSAPLGPTDSNITMCLYQSPLGMDTSSAASLLNAVMVDHQMQTEKSQPAVQNATGDSIGIPLVFGELDNESTEATPTSPLPTSSNEDQISVIVKDILAKSGKTEDHLSFWQYSDVDNAAENQHTLPTFEHLETTLSQISPTGIGPEPVLFKEPQMSKKQRPKSANKQSTATPTSIANAVAEAAASGGTGITILARTHQLPQQQTQQQRAQRATKSITAAPVSMEDSKLCTSPAKSAKQLQSPKKQQQSSTSSSGASSSAASTPTHPASNQQKQQLKQAGNAASTQNPRISPAVALLAGTFNPQQGQNTSINKKSQRKARKENKKQKSVAPAGATAAVTNNAAPLTTMAASSGNNNNLLSNKNNSNLDNAAKLNALTSTTFATTTKTTAAVESASSSTIMPSEKTAQLTTDKLSATSNNSSSLSSNLRDNAKLTQDHQQQKQKVEQSSNKIGGKTQQAAPETQLKFEAKTDNAQLSTSSHTASTESLTSKQDPHMATEDIMAKFLAQPEAQQLQFLNSSSSVCEDEELMSVSAVKPDGADECNNSATAINELKFGDFNEDKLNDTGFICSSTWSSSIKALDPVASDSSVAISPTASISSSMSCISSTNVTPSLKTTKSMDNVDCAAKVKGNLSATVRTSSSSCGSKKSSPVHQIKKGGDGEKKGNSPKSSTSANTSQTSITAAAAKNNGKIFKYSIEELRELSKLSDSRKPPMVYCQKGDCIAQLFVSRQQQQHHHAHNPHVPQYQHMSFSESIDYVSGKRAGRHGHGPNKKHHDHQQMGVSINSSGGSGGGGGMSNQRHMDIIRVQLSLKEEIKLSECENAWQPETLRRMSMANASDEDDDMETVVKKVRGILNKLTPDNFDVLLKEMFSIKMNTEAKMTNVMLLIFEKTISEPNFAPTYARFCKVLFHEIKAENKSLFTSSLITRIQHEFESNVNDANAKAKKLQPTVDRMNECTDPNKKAELRAEMEDLEYQFRRRAWGTVRFIGELFKLQTLTSDRVLHCIESLLEHGCEEKLEYMCKLLTTVGHLLEGNLPDQYQNSVRIEKIFRRIQDIVNRSRGNSHRQPAVKISSRVRFMMQDVLDLRARNWDQPVTHGGRQRFNTNASISKHEEKQHGRNSGNIGGGGGGGSSGGGGVSGSHHQQQHQKHHQMNRSHQEGGQHSHDNSNYFMQKMPKLQQQDNQSLSIDPTKLRFSSGDESTAGMPKLGNSSNYQWRNISNRPVSANAGAVVGTPNLLKRMPSTQTPAPNHHNLNYSSYTQPLQSSLPSHGISKSNANTSNINPSTSSTSTHDASGGSNFSSLQCQEMITRLVEEALNTRDWKPEVLQLWRSCHIKNQAAVLHYLLMDYIHRGTVKRAQRLACANVFCYLMRQKAFDKTTFSQVYARFAEEFPDLLVDVPNGWGYVFEFLGPLMHERLLDFSDIWQCRWREDSYFTDRFVRAFLNYFVQDFGAIYTRDLWHKDYKLDPLVFWDDVQQYREFLHSNNFGFLEQNTKQQHQQKQQLHTSQQQQARGKLQRNPAEHVERIGSLLTTSNDCNMAIDYINTNVHITTDFVRLLTKFLCCDYALTVMTNNNNNNNKSSNNNNKKSTGAQLNLQNFRQKCTPLLRLCLDAQETHEIACIDETVDALQQHFMAEMEDEMAAGDTICTTFNALYESDVIPKESFDKWYKLEIEHSSTYRRPFIDKLRVFIEEL
ncbi:eukaryotic translation initiation factor 4G isoform X1 [Scaptodrosophila lebanonensis]|uniref:Eukaryotic translation initiation factor 4G isoform X1 n=1 Tax=Drosophila lebanonensis TaxID=7225 RepID=A0A6J2T6Z9_DROLE|nr:eukaryotic translation initiation factor 4G isoform X1 [Scaptodrosophila lebanonensis]